VIILLGLIGLVFDKTFVLVERRLASWRAPVI